jgi:peptide/nickel transport system substrate-binding protein
MTRAGVTRRSLLSSALLAGGSVVVLSACGGYDEDSAADGGSVPDTLTLAQPQDVATMDAVVDNGLYSVNVFHGLYDQVVSIDADGELQPRLATDWTSTPDGSSWTFTLRTDATFHDGSPVTAADVAFSFQAVIDDPESLNKIYTNGIASVGAVDDATVRFDLKAPNAAFPRLAYYISIVPQAAYSADKEAFAAAPIGSGPYTFVSWTPDVSIELAANPDYWGGAPAVAKVVVQPVPDEEARVNGLLSGTLDLTALAPSQVETVRGTDGFTVAEVEGNQMVYVGVNVTVAPLDDVLVRRAMDAAIDRDSIIASVLSGLAVPAGQTVAPSVNGWSENLQPTPFDPDAARALLAQSGYAGEPIVFQFPTNGNLPQSSAVAQAIASQLQDVGLNVTLEGSDTQSMNLAWSSKSLKGIYLYQFSPSMMDAATTLNYLYGPTGSGYFRDPEIDGLIAQAAATTDESARLGTIEQIWRRNADQAFIVNLYSSKNAVGMVEGLDFTPRADGHLDFPHASYQA